MGTGSEPPRMLKLRKDAAGSVPVPFSTRPKKGTGTVGNTNHHCHTGHRRSQSPFSGAPVLAAPWFVCRHSVGAAGYFDQVVAEISFDRAVNLSHFGTEHHIVELGHHLPW